MISRKCTFTKTVCRLYLSGSWWDSICGWLENSASLASESAGARYKELLLQLRC